MSCILGTYENMTRELTLLFLIFTVMISFKKDSVEPLLEFKDIRIVPKYDEKDL